MDFYLNLFIIIADQYMLFFINMLVARYAGEELFGDFTVATNALFLIATITTFGIDTIIAHYVPKYYIRRRYFEISKLTGSVKSFLKPIYTVLLVGGILLSLSIIALSYVIKEIDLFQMSHPVYLFIWGAVGLSLYAIFIQFFRAVNYMRTSVLLSLTQTIIYFILSLFTYFYLYPVIFHKNENYFPHIMLVGFIISYVLTVLLSFKIEQKTTLPRFYLDEDTHVESYRQWKEKMYGYTIQNLSKYIFTATPLLVMEVSRVSETSVGLFSAVVSIISLALIALSPIGVLIGPDISAAFAQNREILKKTVRKYLIMSLGISLIIVLIIAAFAEQILLLYKSNFIKALPYTYFCLINVFTYAISLPLGKMIQFSKEGSKIGAKVTVWMLLLQIVASLILIPWLGLLGAIICYIGINIVYNLIMIVWAIKIYHHAPVGSAVV